MLEVVLKKSGGEIVTVDFTRTESEISEEIALCSSVVTVIHTAMLGLFQVAEVDFEYTDNADKILFTLPDGLSEKRRWIANVILDTMLCGLTDLAVTFSDFLSLEVNQL